MYYIGSHNTESMSSGLHSVLTTNEFVLNSIDNYLQRLDSYATLALNRSQYFCRLLGKDNISILEIGCGVAGAAEGYAKLGHKYYGIDIDLRSIDFARSRGVDVEHCDFFDYSRNDKFDVITFSQVLEHITEPQEFLRKVNQTLTPNGIVLCDVPNQNSLSSLLHKFLPLDPMRYGALEYPHHMFAYTKNSIGFLFRKFFVDVACFSAASPDPLFGQAVEYNSVAFRLYELTSKILKSESLLVAVGRKVAN